VRAGHRRPQPRERAARRARAAVDGLRQRHAAQACRPRRLEQALRPRRRGCGAASQTRRRIANQAAAARAGRVREIDDAIRHGFDIEGEDAAGNTLFRGRRDARPQAIARPAAGARRQHEPPGRGRHCTSAWTRTPTAPWPRTS